MKSPSLPFPSLALAAIALLGACATPPAVAPSVAVSPAVLRQQVMDAERGFAQTMAKRDFAAFQSYLSTDTVFFSGSTPLRGKAVVTADWKKYYEKPDAPFSWEPRDVEVLDAGTLALSSGPVRGPDGKIIAIFTSIWRLEDGAWKVIFDKGSKYCD